MTNEDLIKKRFEFLEHTADAKFRAYGRNLSEAFSNSVLALMQIITDVDKVVGEKRKRIEIEAKNEKALLYDFLEELVYLMDTEGFIVSKIEKLHVNERGFKWTLVATLYGDSADNYDIRTQVKAITYNDMLIAREPDFVVIQVVPDL